MHHNIRHCLYLLVLSAAVGYSTEAIAEKGGHRHDKDKRWHQGEDKDYHHSRRHSDHDKLVIVDSDRVIIQNYLHNYYINTCPPGLAKKRNGCLPPGQAKKLYVIGEPLEVSWYPVPDVLLHQLYPVPVGYRYVMVDKDVLLIGEASKKVIDAITLLSAVD